MRETSLRLQSVAFIVLLWSAACRDSGVKTHGTDPGGNGTGSSDTADTDTDADAGDGTDTDANPVAVCDAPGLADISSPDVTVGDGTPQSCTAEALRAAADHGGVIVFDCGEDPLTIEVTSEIVFTSETVLDGEGLITLSGGGASRILYLDSAYDRTEPRLTLQRLTFRDANSPAGGDDTAVGGGAVYRDGGSLSVTGCTFIDNHAPSPGQDIAGGAIYAFGGGETVISGSTFIRNSASNGGAVGSLNGDLTIINSTFSKNEAAGTDGNPGNGGCGGAIYIDGADELTSLCGVTVEGNEAGQIGGGVFRVSNELNGTFAMDRTSVDSNKVTATDTGEAGGLYLQGLALTVTSSAITQNQAFYNGGIWIHTCDVQMTNVTIAENVALGSNGGGMWLSGTPSGTVLNCTVANNKAVADDQICGAVFGEGLAFANTVIANNEAMWVPGCNAEHEDGGGNIEWPENTGCTSGSLVADPLLGDLGDNGGETLTMLPAEDSPAENIGVNCPETDQRGEPRSEPCTAGAVEIQSPAENGFRKID